MPDTPGAVHVNNFPRFVHLDAYEAVQRERAQALRRVEQLVAELTTLRTSGASREEDRAQIARLRGERDAQAAEVARLKRELSEARQQPLVAVVEGQPCAECARLQRKLEAVRELLRKNTPAPERSIP